MKRKSNPPVSTGPKLPKVKVKRSLSPWLLYRASLGVACRREGHTGRVAYVKPWATALARRQLVRGQNEKNVINRLAKKLNFISYPEWRILTGI